MAFQSSRFVHQTSAFNAGQITTTENPSASAVISNGPAFYSYASATDAIATIAAANYFTSVAYQLKVNDVIMVVASDASEFLQVDAVDTSVIPATISVVSFTASAAVDTANIVDGAVTNAKVNAAAAISFSKLAALASGNIIVGSVATVPTSVAMAGDVTIVAAGTTTIGANKVLSSMIALNTLQYTSVAITAAEFNGAYAAPKVLVAAPGANKLLVLDKVQLLMTYGTAAFAAGGVAAIQYDVTANGAGVIASTTLSAATFQATASTGWNFNAGVVAETFTTCVNKSLALSNVTGAFTTGDSNMVAHIWYKVISTV